jgi:hypothetical protein
MRVTVAVGDSICEYVHCVGVMLECVCVHVRVCVRACVRMRVCVCACVRVRVRAHAWVVEWVEVGLGEVGWDAVLHDQGAGSAGMPVGGFCSKNGSRHVGGEEPKAFVFSCLESLPRIRLFTCFDAWHTVNHLQCILLC